MSLSSRISRHVRSNVVAYVALFAALGGTAAALPGHRDVKSDDLARNAVKKRAIAANAVRNQELAGGAVTSNGIRDGAVVQGEIGDAAVTSAKLAEDSVVRQKIARGSINGGKLANGAVDSGKVENGTLQALDFAPGEISDGFLVNAPTGSFTIARAGRVYVTATLEPICPTPPCSYTVEVDDVAVPGATFTLSSPTGQVTLVGVTAALAAGPHTISLESTGAGAGALQPKLGGILLQ